MKLILILATLVCVSCTTLPEFECAVDELEEFDPIFDMYDEHCPEDHH